MLERIGLCGKNNVAPEVLKEFFFFVQHIDHTFLTKHHRVASFTLRPL